MTEEPINRKLSPSDVRKQNLNPIVESDIELQSQLITPQTGRGRIGQDLDRLYKIKYHDGNDHQVDSYWDLATAITSDTRLSNLTPTQERYVQWAIKIQGMCLMQGLPKSASLSDWFRATVCEPSLGRGMALRNNLQTVQSKSEAVQIEESSPKRSIFGGVLGGGK